MLNRVATDTALITRATLTLMQNFRANISQQSISLIRSSNNTQITAHKSGQGFLVKSQPNVSFFSDVAWGGKAPSANSALCCQDARMGPVKDP